MQSRDIAYGQAAIAFDVNTIDDVRPAPEGDDWDWLTSVNEAIGAIIQYEKMLALY